MTDSIQSLPAESLPDTTFEKPQPKPYQQIQVEGKKSFQCLAPGCQKIFKFKCDMERHVLIHTKEKPITCPYPDCNKGFKRPEALRYHVDTMHVNRKIFTCPIPDCGYQIHTKELIENHVGLHSCLRFCAEISPNDGKIYVPWKKIDAWKRKYWIKYKTNFEQNKKNNQDLTPSLLTERSWEDLTSNWDVLEEEDDSSVSAKFFERLESLKNKSDTIWMASLGDDSSCVNDAGSKQITQESEGNKEKQFDLLKAKREAKENIFRCPYLFCNQTFKTLEMFRYHVFPRHVNHQVFMCPLKDCGWQTHQKELLELYHLGKHEVIQKYAENSPNDGKIYLPWKNIEDWERRYWVKCKSQPAELMENNQGSSLPRNGLEDLKSNWDILSCLEEDSVRSEKFFDQIESWKKRDLSIFSRDSSDTLSLASFQENSSCLIPGARNLLRSICKEMTQENTVGKLIGKQPNLSKQESEDHIKSPASGAFDFDFGLEI